MPIYVGIPINQGYWVRTKENTHMKALFTATKAALVLVVLAGFTWELSHGSWVFASIALVYIAYLLLVNHVLRKEVK